MESLSTWKVSGLFKADAQRCASEIASIKVATPSNIVEFAKDESTELHKCFDWNDDVAAEKWRLQQARQVVCNLVIKTPDNKKSETRTFYSVPRDDSQKSYQPVKLILRNEDSYNQLLKQAKSELVSFERKYRNLAELELVFEEIKKVV